MHEVRIGRLLDSMLGRSGLMPVYDRYLSMTQDVHMKQELTSLMCLPEADPVDD